MLMSFLFLALAAAQGCQGLDSGQPMAGTRYGPAAPFGQGSARTYLEENGRGEPISLGVEFTEAALADLPAHAATIQLDLPPAASRTQYTFVTLDWNPHGHEPRTVYDKPHFDVHFYMVAKPSVERIAGGADPVILRAPFAPPGHVAPGNQSVPAMGVHWVNPAAPEFKGQGFANTFIYGANAGRLIFLEPMTALSFLRSKEDFSSDVTQLTRVQTTGWYPTRYRVHYLADRKSYRIELGGLQRREASD